VDVRIGREIMLAGINMSNFLITVIEFEKPRSRLSPTTRSGIFLVQS
jgi:hypothetical protein